MRECGGVWMVGGRACMVCRQGWRVSVGVCSSVESGRISCCNKISIL